MRVFINETHVVVNHEDGEERSVRVGAAGPNPEDVQSFGDLYRRLRERLGRCMGHVYIDRPGGQVQAIGWVFRRRTTEEDAYLEGDPHLCETWVTVETAPRRVIKTQADVRGRHNSRKNKRSPGEVAMGHRYVYERHDRLDDGQPAYPVTDLRTGDVTAVLVETSDQDAALIVRALNEANP